MTKLNIISKDILTVEKGIIVQQVNAIGKTEAGLSGAINAKYPLVKEHYLKAFNEGYKFTLGEVFYDKINETLLILSIISQQNVGTYKVQTNFEALTQGLKQVAMFSKSFEYKLPVYIPYFLGSGLAGGPTQQTKQETWAKVSELIISILPEATICKLD